MGHKIWLAVFIFFLMCSTSLQAIEICQDFLETGNPGGWSGSVKTFDDTWMLSQGDTVDVDIWLHDVPETINTSGFYIVFDPAQVSVVSVESHDNTTNPSGPWVADFVSSFEVVPGQWFFSVGNFGCVTPDGDGDIILARVTFQCNSPGDTDITISTVPGFDTVVGCSGFVYDQSIVPSTITIHLITVYEDAEDGMTDRWYVYDNTPDGAEIFNVFDDDCQSNVIQLSGSGDYNGYHLRNDDGSRWHNTTQKVLQWSMKYDEFFVVYVDTETTAGHRYLTYFPRIYSLLGIGEYVYYGLGTDVRDGQWHIFTRDLQSDLALAQPGVVILEVNGLFIRGSGRVDNVMLLNEMPTDEPVYEDGEDGTTDRWYVYDDTPGGAAIYNVFDADRQSNVIELSGSGWDNGYRLTRDDGSRWYNANQVVIEWSMKYGEYFVVYIDVETTAGRRYLKYMPVNTSSLGTGAYVGYGLGTDAMDGQWHTFVRDLQVDLELAQPGLTILEVNGFLIRGSGVVDDIRMLDYFEECSDGEVRLCPNQQGICFEAEEICTDSSWSSCDYTALVGYEVSEVTCEDGLDNDCDGLTDCNDSSCAGPPCDEATVYEDAEDGLPDRWYVYDNIPADAQINNVFDADRQSNVIELAGTGEQNGYRLTRDDGSKWHNTTQKVLEWKMKYSEYFIVYIDVETTAGRRYLKYMPVNISSLGMGEYVEYGLGADAMNGQWHTFVRDLQADLNVAQTDVTILEINGLLIRGSGRVDDVKLNLLGD